MKIEEKLREMGLTLPKPEPLRFPFVVRAVRLGSAVFTCGGISIDSESGKAYIGKVGVDVDIDYGKEAARVAVLNCLAALAEEAGSLDNVRRMLKLSAFVNCSDDFTQVVEIVNAASEIVVSLWGEAGRHARSVIGASQLPRGVTVEVELIAEVS